MTARTLARSAYHLARFTRNELKADSDLRWGERVRWCARGFYSARSKLYDFDAWDPGLFVTDVQFYLKVGLFNGEYRHLLHDKLAFHGLMSAAPHARPRLFAVVHRGRLGFIADGDAFDLRRHLAAGGRVVVKPTRGGGGKGVSVWQTSDGDPLVALAELVAGFGDSIVVDHVRQADYASAIFDGATNTVRMLTVWDDDADEPFLAAAVHRFGTAASEPTDNFSGGGLSVAVDVASGRMGRAATKAQAGRGGVVWVDVHPDTAAPVAGVAVPGWASVVKGLLDVAGRFPFLSYVGWDVVVTDGGFVVLEANSTPDVDLMQMHRPLLADQRTRGFFRGRGGLSAV